MSPAFNLNLASVIFASANGVSKSSDTLTAVADGSGTKEWKLTLLDSAKTVKVTDGSYVTKSGDTVTVPYTYTGSDVSQISVMITSGAYNVPGTEILYYGKLNTTLAASGIGTFTLPNGLPAGYKIYILAEDVNGEKYTDYASAPVEITVAEPTYEVSVTNGTGGGSYAAGSDVTITADSAPQGKQFKEWTGVDGLSFTSGSAASAEAIFTMPAKAVTVTATYEDIPVVDDTAAPSITSQPQNVSVKAGEKATFTVTATGTVPLTYQWMIDRKDGNGFVTIDGATASTYTTSAVDKACNGFQYKCVITNVKGSVESDVVTLTVTEETKPEDTDYEITAGGDQTDNEPSDDTDDKQPDNQTPDDNGKDDVPKTGDNTPIAWLLALMFISGTGIFITRKKKVVK